MKQALDEYENLSSNCSYFLSAIMMSLAPSCLLAPLYTYDHYYCMPRNFLINQFFAESLCLFALIVSCAPFVFYLVLPRNLRRLGCLGSARRLEKNQPIIEQADDILDAGDPAEHRPKPTVCDRVNRGVVGLAQFCTVLVILAGLAILLAVHVCQYRIFMGAFAMTGGANEIWSLVMLLVTFKMYRQDQVTEQDILEKQYKYQLQEKLKRVSIASQEQPQH